MRLLPTVDWRSEDRPVFYPHLVDERVPVLTRARIESVAPVAGGFFGGLPAILGFHGNFFDLHQAFGRVVLKPRGQPRVSVLLGFALRRAGSELRVWTEVQGLPPTVIAAVRQIFGGGGHVILGAGVRSKEGACQQDGRAQH